MHYPMSSDNQRGFVTILGDRHFVRLWIAQTIGLAAQNGIHFVQMVMIERLTGSSAQMGLMILAFSLPGILFSAFAGVVVDRLSKKRVLLVATILRVFTISSYVVALKFLEGWHVLIALYGVTFLSATIAQFFAPALWAKVPLIIGEEKLLAANALFNLTYAIAQAAGLIILAPLAVKLIGIENSFLVIAGIYLIAAVLVAALPGDKPARREGRPKTSPSSLAWKELREGWNFIVTQRGIYMPMAQLTLVATLIMVVAMLAPGFTARVLGMAAEDAVYVFAPAGVGMFLATFILGRFSRFLTRETWINLSLIGTTLGFAALGLVSRGHIELQIPLLEAYPEATISVTTAIMGITLFTGYFMATVNTVAQTALQERSPASIRGRVYSVQFLLANLVGIPPLLGLGALADYVGIPIVCFALAGVVLIMWAISLVHALRMRRAEEQAVFADEIEDDRSAGRKRVLIIAPTNDSGAQSAPSALAEGFAGISEPESRVIILDGANLLPPILRRLVYFIRFWIMRGSWLWKSTNSPSSADHLIRTVQFLVGSPMKHALLCHRPDAIICLDPLFAHLLAYANRKLGRPASVVTVVTDLIRIHPLWLCRQVDLCTVPSKAAEESILDSGMPREIVKRVGLPISLQFNGRLPDKTTIRQHLGWPTDKPTILMIGGPGRTGSLFRASRAIAQSRPNAHLVIVTGRNERLLKRLNSVTWGIETKVLGFVENMPELMGGADLIVMKAGSSILAEALAARLPIIFVETRGRERENLTYAVSAGVGVTAETPDQIAIIIGEWLRPDNPTIDEMSARAGALAQPAAAERIAQETIQLVARRSADSPTYRV